MRGLTDPPPLVLNDPALDLSAIVEDGSISWDAIADENKALVPLG